MKKISSVYMNKNKCYDDDYYLKNHLNKINSIYGFFIEFYYRYLASYIFAKAARIEKSDKILDIGCGVGILVKQFNKLGFEAIGVDVNKPAIKNSIFPKKCLRVKTTARLNFSDNYFDLIVSREALEHIPPEKIDDCIKEWDRVSKGKMVHIIAVSERGISAINDPSHVNVQSENWWIKKFKQHGYKAMRKPRKLFFSPFGSSGYLMFIKD